MSKSIEGQHELSAVLELAFVMQGLQAHDIMGLMQTRAIKIVAKCQSYWLRIFKAAKCPSSVGQPLPLLSEVKL